MLNIDCLVELGHILSTHDSVLVITALRRDALIWDSLQDAAFFKRIAAAAGDHFAGWIPANIALAALKCGYTSAELCQEPMLAVEKPLRQKAIPVYEKTIQQSTAPKTLEEAGLLALALRERRRLTHEWSGFCKEIAEGSLENESKPLQNWGTALTCLLGMIPDPQNMLATLLGELPFEAGMALVNHILLANPIAVEERAKILLQLIRPLRQSDQVRWLYRLGGLGEDQLAAILGSDLINSPHFKSEGPSVNSTLAADKLPWELGSKLQSQAALQRFAGQNGQALDLYKETQQVILTWLNQIKVRIASLASDESETTDAEFPQIESEFLFSEEALELSHHPMVKKSLLEVDSRGSNPYWMIEQAWEQFSAGDTDDAKDLAQSAVSSLAGKAAQSFESAFPKEVYNWQPAGSVQKLVDMGMLSEALQLVVLLLQGRPVDGMLLDLANQILQQLGDLDNAVQYARLGTLLFPDHITRRRRLADLLEDKGEWAHSLPERSKVISQPEQAVLQDWVSYISSAMASGQPQMAVEAGRKTLAAYPNHGPLNAMMGKSLVQMSSFDEAIQYLGRAILLSPEDAETWLMLADCYQKTGEPQRGLETLRAASLAVPESPEVNFKLASSCLAANLPSEALPFLKKAARLTPESQAAAIQLGQTLHRLGHLAEAKKALAQARAKWGQDPDLAFEQAEVLLEMGEKEAAIQPLEVAVQNEPPNYERYMLYAETLLGDWLELLTHEKEMDYARLVNAQRVLGKAIQAAPGDFKANLMLAEVYSARGQHLDAFEIYRRLVESPIAQQPEWAQRTQGGLGRAALKANQVETALAALQEATQAQPDNLFFQRLMAEACLAGNLDRESLEAARYAHRLAPDDLDTLSWFASLALKLGAESEAAEALQCATQLAPDKAENWLRLATIRLSIGDLDGARKDLEYLTELKDLTSDQYRQAAYAYLRMEDQGAALNCFKQAVEISLEPDVSLLFELSRLLMRVGQPDLALEVLQEAIDNDPRRVSLHVFQSDLLSALNRPQAAMACLEHAQQLMTNPLQIERLENEIEKPHDEGSQWGEVLDDPAGIQARLACLLRRLGNVPAAVQHMEKALDLNPYDLPFRLLVTQIYLDMLQEEKAEAYLHLPVEMDLEAIFLNVHNLDECQREALIHWTVLQAERCLDRRETQLAKGMIELAAQADSHHARLLAASARLAAQSGDLKQALNLFEQCLAAYLPVVKNPQVRSSDGVLAANLTNEFKRGQEIWFVEAAIECHRWADAKVLSRKAVEIYPHSCRVQLELGRVLVLAVERQGLSEELGCLSHAPGAAVNSEEAHQEFVQALRYAEQLGQNTLIQTWKDRGEAAFAPTVQNIRVFASSSRNGAETAALMNALRRMNNPAAAMQVAGDVVGNADTWLQLALCCRETDPEQGLTYALKVVEQGGYGPLGLAAAAILAEKAGRETAAYEYWNAALGDWANEPQWQGKAARLAFEAEDLNRAETHYTAALALQPDAVDYALQLAHVYLHLDKPANVIRLLTEPTYLEAGQAPIWLALAAAYYQTGAMVDAIQCGERAAELNLFDIQALQLCSRAAICLGQIEEAEKFNRKAFERDPKDAEVVEGLARLLEQNGKPDQALEVIEMALPTREESATLLYDRARLVYRIHGAQKALPLLHQLANQDTENSDLLALLGHAEDDCGNKAESIHAILKALRLNPDQEDLTLFMGKVQKQAGQLDQAIYYLSETIRLAPGNAEAYMELAETHLERREQQLALKVFKQAIKVNPDDFRPYFKAAQILRESKDYISAEDMLRKAAKLAPQDINIRRQLGAMIALNLVHNAQEANSYR